MNRREMLKSVMAIPIIGLGVMKVTQCKSKPTISKNKLFTDNLNWGSIVVDRGWDAYIESIRAELERIIGEPVEAGYAIVQHTTINFRCDELYIFSIEKTEYRRHVCHRKCLIAIPETRWVAFCWGLNDVTNMYIDFIQRFDPKYNPRDYRD